MDTTFIGSSFARLWCNYRCVPKFILVLLETSWCICLFWYTLSLLPLISNFSCSWSKSWADLSPTRLVQQASQSFTIIRVSHNNLFNHLFGNGESIAAQNKMAFPKWIADKKSSSTYNIYKLSAWARKLNSRTWWGKNGEKIKRDTAGWVVRYWFYVNRSRN